MTESTRPGTAAANLAAASRLLNLTPQFCN